MISSLKILPFLLVSISLSVSAINFYDAPEEYLSSCKAVGDQVRCFWDYGFSQELEFKYVSHGLRYHACGMTVDNIVACSGQNQDGQCNVPAGEFISVSAGGYHSCGVTVENDLICWGNNDYGQSSVPEGKFRSVSAGLRHTCAVTMDNEEECWGYFYDLPHSFRS